MKIRLRSVIATISFSILLGLIGPIYYLIDDSLYRLPNEYFIYSIIDIIATSLVVLLYLTHKYREDRFKSKLLLLFADRRFINFIKITLLICIAIVAWRFREISSFIAGGNREELVFDIGLSQSVSFAVSFAVIVIALQLSGLDLSRAFNFIPLMVLILGSVLQLSRSEILFTFFYSITLFSLSHKYFLITFRKLVLAAFLMGVLAGIGLLVNIQQGRADDLFDAFQNSSLAFTSYRSASLYLGYHFSSMNYGYDNIFYPFFGFPYEKLISIFFQIDTPLSTGNSDYFYKFIPFGQEPHQVGNVYYPLSSFYYYQFSYLGILIKAVFCVLLIHLSLILKFYFLSCYICYSVLFVSVLKHPLLNADSTYQALFFLVFDFFARFLLRIHFGAKSLSREPRWRKT